MTGRDGADPAVLAVVVLNWNGRDDTLACLASLRPAAEEAGRPVRVYVPDNGSTDGSVEAVRGAFPEACVIENGANLGFAGGNNRGWRAAAADGAGLVLFLNNDATVAPDVLRRLCGALERDPSVGAASPRIYKGVPPSGEVWFEKGEVTPDRFRIAAHVPADSDGPTGRPYNTDFACGCAMLLRAATLEATGGFDEGFFAYYEDVDLSLKLRAKGLHCVVVPDAAAWHRVSGSTGGGFSPASMFYTFRNGRYLARRHAPDAATWARYRRGYARQCLSQARWLAKSVSRASAAAGLQGALCALAGQKGPRPAALPDAPFRWAAAGLAALP
jgi:GT2 family glycosyltransferase